jgi:hypothetical protein
MFDIEKSKVFISIHIVALSIPKMFHEVISKIIMRVAFSISMVFWQ